MKLINRIFWRKPPFEILFSANGSGEKPGVLIHAVLYVVSQHVALVDALVSEFKQQREKSPPETKHLLIVVLGPCDAASFLTLWKSSVSRDPIAAAWMGSMVIAELGCDGGSGSKQFHSLLDGSVRQLHVSSRGDR